MPVSTPIPASASVPASAPALAAAPVPTPIPAAAPESGAEPTLEALSGLLLESLAALAEADGAEAACRLAGRAYVALRHESPQQARRFDVLLHRLTRRLSW
ncbi:hypothetical protein [Candidimonas nitroreducens]|uniref:hypothetical protein n=1 Tax=Candidimonas nitroreducens TaxID=683354 RepID=UPI0018E93545|nr:hypothetical protein [Candidimonas nitroreducens]